MNIEKLIDDIKCRHNLTSVHIFDRDGGWRVFAFRPKDGFSASCEEGGGPNIAAAMNNLDARLTAGPINRNNVAPLPRLSAAASPAAQTQTAAT